MASEDRVLGRIGITLKGEYDNNKTYTKLNQVTYKGSSYTLKVAEAKGILPTNSDCWICSAKKGDKGDKGDTGDIGPIGPKPVNGIDYNTDAEREEFKNAVVADSKADLEIYIKEKEKHLDDYAEKKEKTLDNYVTDTVKPKIDTYVEETTKKDIDEYEKKKETALDTYTDTKKTEIDNYVTNTSKPALDQYEKEKETELETAKDTAISEFDAHAESVLTETNDLFNALDTEKASGTELYIEDAKPCRVINTEIGGMYKQETTTGAQLFNYTVDTLKQLNTIGTWAENKYVLNGITFTINTDLTIGISGTATQNATLFLMGNTNNQVEIPGKYICVGYTTNNVCRLRVINYNNGTHSLLANNSSAETATAINLDTYQEGYIGIFIPAESTISNATIKPILSNTATTSYEQFTGGIASPNPDYPQEIEQVESVKLMCDSSNLFNVTDYNNLNLIRNGNAEITKTKNDFSFKTSADNYSGIYIIIDRMKSYIDNYIFEESYFYSFDVIATKKTSFRYGTSGVTVTTVGTTKQRLSFIGKLTKPLTMYSLSQEAGTTITISNIKIAEIGDTEYTPYQNQAINIDLKGNKLCAVSDTIKDKLLIDRNGNVALQKNVNYSTFDAFTTVNGSFSDRTQFILTLVNCVKNVEQNSFSAISNCMLKNTVDGGMGYYGTTANGSVRVTVSNDLLGITQEDTSSTKLNAAKTFLQNLSQTPEIYYPAEVPELIDLGQLTELPKTFNGINNIWAETNLGNTEIEIEYVQDVKKLLEKQAEQQNARLDNIETLLSTTQTSALLLDNMQEDLEKEVK